MSAIFPWSVVLAWVLYVLAVWAIYGMAIKPWTQSVPLFWRPTLRIILVVVLLAPTLSTYNEQLGVSPALFVFAQGVWGGSALVMIKGLLAWLLFGAITLALVAWFGREPTQANVSSVSNLSRVEPKL
ncbi:MAG: hypothetical protein U0998_09430 [Moraxellaceae bacterium]|nr:hypothetical protein [Moraxellaceae bacterium]MDZ4387398.1 hypothetical protein [Moraxellaceae bacterium]